MEKVKDLPANEVVGVNEIIKKFQNSIHSNENLTFDELVDAVEDCYNKIWGGIDVNKPYSIKQDFILPLFEVGCIVYNALDGHRLEWYNSKSKLSKEEIFELCLAKEFSSSNGGLGLKDVVSQIVKTGSPIVRCSFILMLLHYFV